MDTEKIKSFLKIRENQYLVLLMLFTIIIRLYYFIKLGNQPIWWDEGDYLSIAKIWALDLEKPEWWGIFTGIRPLLIPLIWAFFIKIGIGELGIRFITLFLPSVITVYLVYAVGRDLYNSKIGLIAGFMISVYWVHLFYSFRLLTDIPALFLAMLTIYFFWSRYIVKEDEKGLYLAVLFGVLAFAARFPHASILVVCFLFLLAKEKADFFKKKINWKALALIFVLLLPYVIYFISTNFYVVQFYFGPKSSSLQTPYLQVFKNIFGLFPSLFGPGLSLIKNVFFIFLFIGIFSLYKLFLGFDLFWKRVNKKFDADFFILLWILSQLVIYVGVIRAANDRWLLLLIPALFLFSAKGFYFLWNYLKRYAKPFGILIIVFLVFFGGYFQLSHTDALIEDKAESYKEVMLAGLWLKENTSKDARIVTASVVQNQYYSERTTYDFYHNNRSGSLEDFEQKVMEIHPDFYIINIFQSSFTPEWAYTYPQEKGLEPVQYYLATKKHSILYGIPEGQPLLIIYKF